MVIQALVVEEYRFNLSFFGYDHLEGLQLQIDNVIGKDVIYIYNKRGSTIMMLFVGKQSRVKRAIIIGQVEEVCKLKFVEKKDVYYQPHFLDNLKRQFGDKLAVR